jgi:hypothetical protein
MSAPVRLTAGRPAWLLRAAMGLACALAGALLVVNGVGGTLLGLYVGVVVVSLVIPASAAPALVIAFAAGAMALAGGDPLRPGVLAMIALLHFVHVCAALAAVLPAASRLHPAALREPARRFVAVQFLVLALAGVVALLPAGGTDSAVEVVGLLCVVGLAVGAVVLLRRRA